MVDVQLLVFGVALVLIGAGFVLFPRDDGPIEIVRGLPRWVRGIARDATVVGDPVFIIAGSFLVAASMSWLGLVDTQGTVLIAFVPAATLVLVAGIKRAADLPRPDIAGRVRGSGFPSGHTAGAAVASATISIVVIDAGLFGSSILGFAAVFVGFVALTRVASGVHYAEDVIVGAGVGLAFAVLGTLAL